MVTADGFVALVLLGFAILTLGFVFWFGVGGDLTLRCCAGTFWVCVWVLSVYCGFGLMLLVWWLLLRIVRWLVCLLLLLFWIAVAFSLWIVVLCWFVCLDLLVWMVFVGCLFCLVIGLWFCLIVLRVHFFCILHVVGLFWFVRFLLCCTLVSDCLIVLGGLFWLGWWAVLWGLVIVVWIWFAWGDGLLG